MFKKILFPKTCEQLGKHFFRKTDIAGPIITLDVGVQLFWATFDPLLAVVPLKVALGLRNIYFWEFQKSNHASVCQV